MTENKMSDHAWSFVSESIDRLPEHTYSLSIGQHFKNETGLTDDMVCEIMDRMIEYLSESPSAVTIDIAGTHIYIIRRDKAIEICTYADIVDLGWEEAAKLIDEHSEPL